jgi:hypothetical protein
MIPNNLELHPIYGAIPSEGEFVDKGEIIGLSVNEKEIVRAPKAGRVRMLFLSDPHTPRLMVQIVSEAA